MATQIETVMNAMIKNPSLTASQLAKQLNISPTNIYALRHVAKKRIQAQRKTETNRVALKQKHIKASKQIRVPILRHAEKADGLTTVQVKMLKKDLAEAQAEVKKLNDWCLDWRKKCESLVSERDQAQADALANRTIVGYLENRLIGLLKG